MSNRHLARTLVLQSLFQWDFNERQENVQQILTNNKKEFAPDFDDQGFAQSLLNKVIALTDELDGLIVKYAPEWPLEKITAIDRNVLRIGIYELKFDKEIPPKVAINEAIEIAKAYGGESSGKFVNGVLGSVFKDMQEKGEKVDFKEENQPHEYSAGGVVFKKDEHGVYQFVLILDAYNKWTFPKGKIELNEDREKAAMREVSEEVGLNKLINHGYLGSLDIKVNEPNKKAVPKTIYYYLLEALDSELSIIEEQTEMKDAKWVSAKEALEGIGYENAKEIFQVALNKLQA